MTLIDAKVVLFELRALGATVVVQGDDIDVDAPKGVLTADRLKSIKDNKPDVLALLNEEDILRPYRPNRPNDDYWSRMAPADYAYATGPRNWPEPCVWCGGRRAHGKLCKELRLSWLPTLPNGKHKGVPLAKVPRDYLRWFLKRCSDQDLRDAIKVVLG